MSQIQCTNCRKEIDNASQYCSFCGHKIVNEKPEITLKVDVERQLPQCPNCKRGVADTSEECPYCGNRLNTKIISCPKCKRDITSTSETCGYCGYRLKVTLVDENEKKSQYLLDIFKIVLIAVPLTIILAVLGIFKGCSRNDIEQVGNSPDIIQPIIKPIIDTVKIKLPNADALLSNAKDLYKKGKYNESDVVLTQIINDYTNSTAAVEASKFKIIVIKAIRDNWNKRQNNTIQDYNSGNAQQNVSTSARVQKFISTEQAIVNVDFSTVKGYDKIYLTFDYSRQVIILSNPSKGSKFTFIMVSEYKEYGTMVGDTHNMIVTSTDAPAVKRFFFSLDTPSVIFMENNDGKTTTFGGLTRL